MELLLLLLLGGEAVVEDADERAGLLARRDAMRAESQADCSAGVRAESAPPFCWRSVS
jgi:predicted metalloprotease